MSKIIKCMFFVLLAAVLPLSVHAQQVTLHLQDVTVRKAFRELEVKGNVSLVYEKNDVDLTRKVTVKVDNQPISKALDQILKGQELIYKIKDNHIILSKLQAKTQVEKELTISGRVTDATGELLIGVNVAVNGVGMGITDIDGNYQMKAPVGSTLTFTYVGYKSLSVKVKERTTINVRMEEDNNALDEVVVIGYGTQKKVCLLYTSDAADE